MAEELARFGKKPFDEADSREIARYIGSYIAAYSTARSLNTLLAQSPYKNDTPAAKSQIRELAMTLRREVDTINRTVPALIKANIDEGDSLNSLESLATNTLVKLK